MAEREIIGIGPAGWDAGTDLFLDVARQAAGDRTLAFRWYGRRTRGIARWLDHDVELSGLRGRVEWVAGHPTSSPAVTHPPASVLVVTARSPREAEVARLAAPDDLPVVAFDLRPDGDGISFPDTAELADQVREVLARPCREGGRS